MAQYTARINNDAASGENMNHLAPRGDWLDILEAVEQSGFLKPESRVTIWRDNRCVFDGAFDDVPKSEP